MSFNTYLSFIYWSWYNNKPTGITQLIYHLITNYFNLFLCLERLEIINLTTNYSQNQLII